MKKIAIQAPMRIIKVDTRDSASLRKDAEIWTRAQTALGQPPERGTSVAYLEQVCRSHTNPLGLYWGVEGQSNCVIASARTLTSIGEDSREIAINIAVLPDFMRQGYGRCLFESVLGELTMSERRSAVRATVPQGSVAAQFCEALGFKAISTEIVLARGLEVEAVRKDPNIEIIEGMPDSRSLIEIQRLMDAMENDRQIKRGWQIGADVVCGARSVHEASLRYLSGGGKLFTGLMFDGGKCVGFGQLSLSPVGRVGVLQDVYVVPEERGRGVAKSIVQSLMQRLSLEQRVERLQATVLDSNLESRRLFSGLGYAPLRERTRYILIL
ncbi:GNAT family N-acetyltransferase [Luteococcus sp. H138]|uniref:GNAT family N-acetyltransferase n=1 Tax=unclassified Luteococcus TaxID=2639923 RepID=UPI00313CC03F